MMQLNTLNICLCVVIIFICSCIADKRGISITELEKRNKTKFQLSEFNLENGHSSAKERSHIPVNYMDIKTMCRYYKPKCIDTGHCELSGDSLQCICPNNLQYEQQKGCTGAKCPSEMTNCAETGGHCIDDKCICPKHTAYKKNTGCQVLEDSCKKFMPKCLETSGTCALGKCVQSCAAGEIVCKCPGNYYGSYDRGCESAKCRSEMPNCAETGGHCIYEKDGKVQCVCPKDTEYKLNIGCQVRNDSCQEIRPKCLETAGSCVLGNCVQSCALGNIVCKCPGDLSYLRDEGCRGDYCVLQIPDCLPTGGHCITDKNGKYQCVCPKGAVYKKDVGCPDEDAKCNAIAPKCLDSGGECIFNEEPAHCLCPKNMLYKEEEGCTLDLNSKVDVDNTNVYIAVGVSLLLIIAAAGFGVYWRYYRMKK